MIKANPNKLRKVEGITTLLVSALAFAPSAEAISLIGNYLSINDGVGTNINSTLGQKAVGFTLPTGNGYKLDNIVLRLANYNTTAGDVALIQIYADAAKTSTNPNGTTLQSVLFTNPTSSSDTTGNFTFTPQSEFIFNADTRYWLLVDATAGDFTWLANNPAVTPTGFNGTTFNDYQRSTNNGSSYTNSIAFNSFDINATEVPFEFEATGGIGILGAAWLWRRHLKNKKS